MSSVPLQAYLDAALAGDQPGCRAIARGLLAAGWEIGRLYMDLFQAAQYRVGELWQAGA